jgi:hypothetical protein
LNRIELDQRDDKKTHEDGLCTLLLGAGVIAGDEERTDVNRSFWGLVGGSGGHKLTLLANRFHNAAWVWH